MTISFTLTCIDRKDNSLELAYQMYRLRSVNSVVESDIFTIQSDRGGSTMFKIRVSEYNQYLCKIHIQFYKKERTNNQKYVMKYKHIRPPQLEVNKTIYADDLINPIWHQTEEGLQLPVELFGNTSIIIFKINVSLIDESTHKPASDQKIMYTYPRNSTTRKTPNASLYDDTELTDIELRGEDGSVFVHKAIAAAASPVLRRMFAGAWRETAEGVVKVPNITKATLQHLKAYIYLDTVPNADLEPLMLLASMYMLPDLEKRCANMMISSVTSENARDLIYFAASSHVDELFYGILQRIQDGSLKVEDIRKQNNTAVKKTEKNEAT